MKRRANISDDFLILCDVRSFFCYSRRIILHYPATKFHFAKEVRLLEQQTMSRKKTKAKKEFKVNQDNIGKVIKETKKAINKEVLKYELTLSMKGGETYSSFGQTISEALANLGNPSLLQIKSWGTFLIKDGKKQAELMMRPLQIKRILSKFASSFAKDIFEKKIIMGMK